ncbi:MAG: hypothetical protein ABW092_08485 [Candidatus Thiodiazotropha sp.]
MMNRVRVTSLVVFLCITGSAIAMPPFGGSCEGQGRETLQQRLDLSDEQAESVETLLQERFQSRLLMHKRHHDEREQHRAETREQLTAVLSEAQVEQLEAYRLWHERAGRPDRRR